MYISLPLFFFFNEMRSKFISGGKDGRRGFNADIATGKMRDGIDQEILGELLSPVRGSAETSSGQWVALPMSGVCERFSGSAQPPRSRSAP